MPASIKMPAAESASRQCRQPLSDDGILSGLRGREGSRSVRRALDHLLRNYASPVTVRDLATLSGRTPYQLIRAFRKELGITPHALLIQIRVLRATMLLERGEPIAGVAVDVGFVDQTHFTRHFKRMHGHTPGRFIKWRISARGPASNRGDKLNIAGPVPADQ